MAGRGRPPGKPGKKIGPMTQEHRDKIMNSGVLTRLIAAFNGEVNLTPTQATIDACHGCDVLIHEVLTQEWLAKRPDFVAYAAQHHTTTTQLVELAAKAKPRLLILYHGSISLRPTVDSERSSPATLLREMSRYPGQIVVGRDLDVY